MNSSNTNKQKRYLGLWLGGARREHPRMRGSGPQPYCECGALVIRRSKVAEASLEAHITILNFLFNYGKDLLLSQPAIMLNPCSP